MIIFFNKKTGKIVGNIAGRFHAGHLDMWIGDKEENGRIVVEWKQTGKKRTEIQKNVSYEPVGTDADGEEIFKKRIENKKIVMRDLEPVHAQKNILRFLDANPNDLYNYKVDVKTKKLIPL